MPLVRDGGKLPVLLDRMCADDLIAPASAVEVQAAALPAELRLHSYIRIQIKAVRMLKGHGVSRRFTVARPACIENSYPVPLRLQELSKPDVLIFEILFRDYDRKCIGR